MISVIAQSPPDDARLWLRCETVVLHHSGDKADAANLLNATGIWDGIQPCDFVANDLAQGAQKSVFGDKRTLLSKSLGLVVHIAVSKAVVSPISAANYQIDSLGLQIEIDNSRL